MTGKLLFAYGTLRLSTGAAMSRLLQEKSDYAGEAVFQGKLFDLGGYPGAVPSEDASDRVRGDVFILRQTESIMKELDAYEEYTHDSPEQGEYKREKVAVTLSSGSDVTAWIYLYNRPTEGLHRIISGDYDTMKTSV